MIRWFDQVDGRRFANFTALCNVRHPTQGIVMKKLLSAVLAAGWLLGTCAQAEVQWINAMDPVDCDAF